MFAVTKCCDFVCIHFTGVFTGNKGVLPVAHYPSGIYIYIYIYESLSFVLLFDSETDQLYIGGEFVGGSDILFESFQNGGLKNTLLRAGARFMT